MAKHVYVAKHASGLNFTVVLKEEDSDKEVRQHVRFTNGQFQTDDDKLATAIDKLLETNQAIRIRCQKADKAAAEQMALQHKARLATTGAHKGGVTADAIKQSMNTHMQDREAQLQAEGADRQQFADEESLVLSEDANDTGEAAEIPKAKLGLKIGK